MEEPPQTSLQSGIGGRVSSPDLPTSKFDPAFFASLKGRDGLPQRYPILTLHLMVQSPHRVFAYWEVTSERLEEVLAPFPSEEHSLFRLILKWMEIGHRNGTVYDSGGASEWWFPARPGRRYCAELCLHSEEFGTVSVCTSNEVETPHAELAENLPDHAESPETSQCLSALAKLTGLTREVRERGDLEIPVKTQIRGGRPDQLPDVAGPMIKAGRVTTNRPTSYFGVAREAE
ncbi:MAG: DUF4912 domain-containing protein [Terriglobia bacterium]